MLPLAQSTTGSLLLPFLRSKGVTALYPIGLGVTEVFLVVLWMRTVVLSAASLGDASSMQEFSGAPRGRGGRQDSNRGRFSNRSQANEGAGRNKGRADQGSWRTSAGLSRGEESRDGRDMTQGLGDGGFRGQPQQHAQQRGGAGPNMRETTGVLGTGEANF
jgi:hypothetical protein